MSRRRSARCARLRAHSGRRGRQPQCSSYRASPPSRWSTRSPSASPSSSSTASLPPAPGCPRSASSPNSSARAPSPSSMRTTASSHADSSSPVPGAASSSPDDGPRRRSRPSKPCPIPAPMPWRWRDCRCRARRAHSAGSGFLPENWLLEAAPSTILTRLSRGRRAQAWQPCPPQGILRVARADCRPPRAARHRRERRQHRDDLRRLTGLRPAGAHHVLPRRCGVGRRPRLLRALRATAGPPCTARPDSTRGQTARTSKRSKPPAGRTGRGPSSPRHCCTTRQARAPSRRNCHRVLSLAEQFGFASSRTTSTATCYEGPGCGLRRSTACGMSST